MEWKINIENKPEYRIKIFFIPEEEKIQFIGLYKNPNNANWIEFGETFKSMNIDLNAIQEALAEIYDITKKRVDAYENLNEGFKIIKTIEITEAD